MLTLLSYRSCSTPTSVRLIIVEHIPIPPNKPADAILPYFGVSNTASKMHAYITEAVRIMMMYGRSRSSFLPFLWVGLRDWETSSAWTRGKVGRPSLHCERLWLADILPTGPPPRHQVPRSEPSRALVPLYRAERSVLSQAVKQAAEHHEQIKMNQLLMSMGLEPNAPLHSLAHFPSLTARQAQRSGVSEVVLRRRWE